MGNFSKNSKIFFIKFSTFCQENIIGQGGGTILPSNSRWNFFTFYQESIIGRGGGTQCFTSNSGRKFLIKFSTFH